MNGTRLLTKLLPAIALIALAIPASASAQATRTWVSGVGDDANPCSRTAPCKTFAGAISKTAAKGEINCLDPGGFGGVTITKSLTIKCEYTEGGVLVSGTNAIVVNAAATDNVTLIGLDINGIGTGLNGIRVLQAKSVRIYDSQVYGFVRNGVDFEPSGANFKGVVANSEIHNVNGNGVVFAPVGAGATGGQVSVKNSLIHHNGCGVSAGSNIMDAAFNYAVDCGVSSAGGGNTSVVNTIGNLVSDNTHSGVFAKGGVAFNRIRNNEITGNSNGLRQVGSNIISWGGNMVDGNATNGTATGTVTPLKRYRKRK